jgi:hypothetical protein
MANCPPVIFDNISTDIFATLVATAKAQGLDISAQSGSTTYQGMSFTWTYDQLAQNLTIQCTEKPIFIPCTMIESKLRSLIS